ncbi:MAG: glycosyltransferase family 25 protein [Flavobacterium sp.]
MKVFVIHYKKLTERKLLILEQFKKQNIIDYEFIEIDRDDIHNHNISMFQANYNNAQIAISLSHFYAYQQINDKYDNALIFEDDAILSDNFTNTLNKYMTQLPNNYDMLFIGNGCNLHIEAHKLNPNQYIYEKCLYPTSWGGDGASRCTDSYMISKKCANTLCEYINNLSYKINLPIDWWINVAARDNHLKVYWSEPTIVRQGTQCGFFKSSH